MQGFIDVENNYVFYNRIYFRIYFIIGWMDV